MSRSEVTRSASGPCWRWSAPLSHAQEQGRRPSRPPAAAAKAPVPAMDGGVPRYMKPETPEQRMRAPRHAGGSRSGSRSEDALRPFRQATTRSSSSRGGAPSTSTAAGFVRPFAHRELRRKRSTRRTTSTSGCGSEQIVGRRPRSREQKRACDEIRESTGSSSSTLEDLRDEFTPLEPPTSDSAHQVRGIVHRSADRRLVAQRRGRSRT